jgi:hypothetical protein
LIASLNVLKATVFADAAKTCNKSHQSLDAVERCSLLNACPGREKLREVRSQLRVKRPTQLLPSPVQSGFHRGALDAEGIGAP